MPAAPALSGTRHSQALFWLCRAVSPLTSDGGIGGPPAALWPAIVALADRELLLPELLLALERYHLLAAAPQPVQALLADVFRHHRDRSRRMRAQMLMLSSALNAVGLVPVWLKGANYLLADDWERSGRMMHDLDLWLPDPADQLQALAVIENLGFRRSDRADGDEREDYYQFDGRYHEDWPARVEIHRHVIDVNLTELLSDDAASAEAEPFIWNDCRIARLSGSHQAIHALIQATAMAHPPFASGAVPLGKTLEAVRRLHAVAVVGDGAGAGSLSPRLAAVLDHRAWGGAMPGFFTIAECLFGYPSPLPNDSVVLQRMLEGGWRIRWPIIKRFASRLASPRLFYCLRHPSSIPGVIRRYAKACTIGRFWDDMADTS